jgi:diguanylate cyclase (GGDEF)-like protein/PAS domain S-box-containing protein
MTQIPSVEIGTGVSQATDSLGAGLAASIEAISNIRQYRISAVLIYASVHYDLDKVLKGIRSTIGNVPMLGTTTAGEICGGTHQHSVTVVVIASPYLSVHASVGNAVSKDWRKALSQALGNPAISSLVKDNQNVSLDLISGGNSLFAMMFYPGNTKAASSMGYELLETFKLASLGRIPVFGGAAADDWHMVNNSVFLGDQVHHDSVLVAIFETQLEIGISLSHGFIPTGQSMIVSAAEGHEIISLNNAPAANVIANSVGMRREELEGQHVTLTSGHPLGSSDPMGQYSVNVATYFTPGGGVRMTQPVSVGMEITVLGHNPANAVLASEDAFRKSIIRAGTSSPALILVHYCALRPRIIGEAKVQSEIQCLLKIAGTAPTAGFFSFGEDAVADDGVSRHNNGAVAVLVLGKNLSSTAKMALENKQLQYQFETQSAQRILVEVLKQMEESIVVIDREFCITYVNLSFSKLFGFISDEIVGCNIDSILLRELSTALSFNEIALIAAEKSFYREETRLKHKDGQLVSIRLTVTQLTDKEGGITGFVGAITDLTSLIQSSKEKEASDARYRAAFQTSLDAININRMSDGMYLEVNESFLNATGWTKQEVLGRTSNEINVWHDLADRSRLVEILQTNHECRDLEARFTKKNGDIIYGSMSASIVIVNGETCIFSCTRDITERKETENQLMQHKVAIETTNDGFWLTDEKGILLKVNQAYAKMSGYSLDELSGMHISQLEAKEKSLDEIKAHVAKIIAQGGDVFETIHRTKEGREFDLEVSASLIPNSTLIVSFLRDISDRKKYDAELKRIANYDALTGIPNRVLLADRMQQAISQTSRDQNMMAACYLDLDGFKPINDTLGHDAGDTVLIEIAKRIGNTIRGGDTNARLGGDEFVVLLLGLEKGEECVATLERLLLAIAEPIIVKNKSVSVSASIGVSIYPMDDEDPDTLLRHADQAMYVAKQSGKNRFHIYDPALDRRARDQHEFLKSIRHALENNQFELHYQPKVNLRTKELVGVEALIRWQHPERGILPPSAFLHHIENTDLDIEIGEWVIATALAQIDYWQSVGLNIDVSINISGYHLESIHFVEKLKQQLDLHSDYSFGKIQIEVLETVALNDISVVREIISSCRKFGVGFALDDFGTGYSSLSYLSGLPVDVLKIDQSFVRDMLTDKGDRAIVQGIIALAKAFERQTVAEGIETNAHYQALLDMDCELGQGYAIARPMQASELRNWRMPPLGI